MKYMTMCGDVRIKIIPVINIEDIEMSSIAVSYTHLDVYKRQD